MSGRMERKPKRTDRVRCAGCGAMIHRFPCVACTARVFLVAREPDGESSGVELMLEPCELERYSEVRGGGSRKNECDHPPRESSLRCFAMISSRGHGYWERVSG